MEMKQNPELKFLEDCVRFLDELNEKTRVLQLEYDILIGKLVPPVQSGGQEKDNG